MTSRAPLILGFSGVILMLPSLNFESNETMGFFVAVGASLVFAILACFHKLFSALFTDYERSLLQYIFGLLFFLFLKEETSWDLAMVDWSILVTLGLACTAIAHTLWGIVNTKLPAKINASLYFFVPVYSALIAMIFLEEKLHFRTVLGASIIVVGYYWYQRVHARFIEGT